MFTQKKTGTAFVGGFFGHLVGQAAATAILNITEHYTYKSTTTNVPATVTSAPNAYALKRMVEGQLSSVVEAAIQMGVTQGIADAMQAMDDQRLARLSQNIPGNFDIAIKTFVEAMRSFDEDSEYETVRYTIYNFCSLLESAQNASKRMASLCKKYSSPMHSFVSTQIISEYRVNSKTGHKNNLIARGNLPTIRAFADQLAADIGMS